MKVLRYIPVLLLAAAALAQEPPVAQTEAEREAALHPKTMRIVLAGDSTVNHTTGWGSAFCERMSGDVECFNMARNGRSSKSYREQGLWQRALELKPNYILIQFGANDTPGKGPDRETVPETTFAGYLKDDIREARAVGAVPVLVTPLPARKYKNGKHVQTLADYAEAVRRVGRETKTPVIDLNTEANALLDKMTEAEAHAFNNNPADQVKPGTDEVHLNWAGDAFFGAMVARDFASAFPKLKVNIQ